MTSKWSVVWPHIFLVDEAGGQQNKDIGEPSVGEQQSDVTDMEPPGFEEEVMICLRYLIDYC